MKKFLLLRSILAAGALIEPFQAPLQDPHTNKIPENATGVISNPLNVANLTYDFVIAGRGLTGLAIAAKLLENPKNFNVLVIEDGFYGSDYGPIIDDLNTYGQIFGSRVDHVYETNPQIHNRVEMIRSGNGLGGSTLINGGTWTRPHKVQVDSWENVFENKGWNWTGLRKYMDVIEKVRPPDGNSTVTQGHEHHYDPACHGSNSTAGKVEVGIRDRKQPWSLLIEALMDTVNQITKAPSKKDLCCSDPHGVSMFLNTLTKEQVRTDAARSWLKPVLDDHAMRARITVLTGQLVGKVNLEKVGTDYKATGVEFGTHRKDGWNFNVTADKEVLLAAGSAISPLILQYSGIGPKEVLDKVHIPLRLDLPVGPNLQDQTTTEVVSTIKATGKGQGQAAYFATFAEYKKMLNDDTVLNKWAEETVKAGGSTDKDNLLRQYRNYRGWLTGNDSVPYAELFLDTDNRIHFDLWNLLPFTKGYVKILDNDPYLRSFEYNPRYFQNELDLAGQAAASRLARKLTRSGEMVKHFDSEMLPGTDAMPDNATLEDWKNYVRQNFRANYHGVGTCSMMKKEYGGVVDNTAKVYGARNLRVVDGSIPPTQVSSHVMTVYYAMAVRIAEAILEVHGHVDPEDSQIQQPMLPDF